MLPKVHSIGQPTLVSNIIVWKHSWVKTKSDVWFTFFSIKICSPKTVVHAYPPSPSPLLHHLKAKLCFSLRGHEKSSPGALRSINFRYCLTLCFTISSSPLAPHHLSSTLLYHESKKKNSTIFFITLDILWLKI